MVPVASFCGEYDLPRQMLAPGDGGHDLCRSGGYLINICGGCGHGQRTLYRNGCCRFQGRQAICLLSCFDKAFGCTQMKVSIVYQVTAVGGIPHLQLCHIPAHPANCMPHNHIDLHSIAAGIRRKRKCPLQMYEIRRCLFNHLTVQKLLYAILIHVAYPQERASILRSLLDRCPDIHRSRIRFPFWL